MVAKGAFPYQFFIRVHIAFYYKICISRYFYFRLGDTLHQLHFFFPQKTCQHVFIHILRQGRSSRISINRVAAERHRHRHSFAQFFIFIKMLCRYFMLMPVHTRLSGPNTCIRYMPILRMPVSGLWYVRLAELPDGDFAGVLSLLAFDERPAPDAPAISAGLAATLELVQALDGTAPLWCATSGAVSVGGADPVRSATQAALWGFGRTAALEHADRWGGLVDLPAVLDARAVARLAGVLGGTEDQVAVRDAVVYGARLDRAPARVVSEKQRSNTVSHSRPAAADRSWRPRGTVLITGGTGALGAEVARWLARAGADHLVLTSRRGLDAPGAPELRDELTALGVTVTVAACDVTDRTALADLIDNLDGLRAVVHAAGVAQSAPLADLTPAEFAQFTAAKLAGAGNLDAVLGDRELDAFVLFSSIAGVWGSGGQSAYAAANAYLDGLAHRRRAAGLVATSVAWGPWAGGGMLADEGAEDHLRRRGLRPLAPDLAIAALRQALGAGDTAVTVADVDWTRFAPGFTAVRASALLGDLPEVRDALDVPVEETPRRALSADELLDLVQREAAAALGHADPASVAVDRPFRDLGFDSLTAVELRNRLSTVTGLKLPSTLVFDHPSATVLAAFLVAELSGGDAGNPGPAGRGGRRTDRDRRHELPLPGGIDSPEDLWRLVADGGDAISAFPADRGWDVEGLYDPDPDAAGKTLLPRRRLPARRRRVRRRLLRDEPARGPRHRPAAAAAAGERRGRPSNAPASTRGRSRRPAPACSSARTYPGYAARLREAPEGARAVTCSPATRAVSFPDGSPTTFGARGPGRHAWTPRARPRWSRCTSRRGPCGRASARWPWPAGSR